MRQTLHLLILDRDRRRAIVSWHSGRWMLPMLEIGQSARAARAAHDWLARRGLCGNVLGQWLGRVTASGAAIDWLMVARVHIAATDSHASRWTCLSALTSSAHVLDYQHWALTACALVDGIPSIGGPFGHIDWLEEATRFVRCAVGETSGDLEIVPHRVSPAEVVLEYVFGRGRYFLKGLGGSRIAEVTFTMNAHTLAPCVFARTIAFEMRLDGSMWWLTEACPGAPLANHMTVRLAAAVAHSYAVVQQCIASNDSILSALPVLDQARLAGWAATILDGNDDRDGAQRCQMLVLKAFECVEHEGVLRGWVAADLDPSNVIVSGDEVRFIDLDDAYLGPSPIGMSVFVRRLRRVAPECAEAAREVYELAWSRSAAVGRAWPLFDFLSDILECRLGWLRLLAKSESGEIHGLLDAARRLMAARLARLCVANRQIRGW